MTGTYFTGCHFSNGPMSLHRFQLFQTPFQLFQRFHHQTIVHLLWKHRPASFRPYSLAISCQEVCVGRNQPYGRTDSNINPNSNLNPNPNPTPASVPSVWGRSFASSVRYGLFFIQIPYRLFESHFYHVAADKLVNFPTKNGKFCWTASMNGLWL